MPLSRPCPSGPDPSLGAWARVAHYSVALADALGRLEDCGGACKAAASGRWSPEVHDRAIGQLLAVVEAAEAELGRLEMRRRHFATRGRRLG